jgi:hypothetical protein
MVEKRGGAICFASKFFVFLPTRQDVRLDHWVDLHWSGVYRSSLGFLTKAIWCLDQQQTIRVASDGGAYPGRASFGCILQIGETEIAKGKGPAYNDSKQYGTLNQ